MILFFVEGLGLGHAARTWYALKALDGVAVTFGKASLFLQRKGVEVFSIEKPYTLHIGEKGLDVGKSLSSVLSMDVEELKAVKAMVEKASLLVVDSSLLGLLFALFLKKPFLYIGNSTRVDVVYGSFPITQSLFDRLLGRAKALVVPDYPPPFTISLDNLHLPMERYTFLGPTVYVNDIRAGNEMAVVANMGALFHTLPLEIPFPAITQRGLPSKGGREVEDVRPYMGHARAVITHGGHSTIMEALGLGKPLVVVPNPLYKERVNNARGVERNDVGIHLSHPTPHGLRMAVDAALGKKKTARIYEKAYRRMKGYKALVELIEELQG